MDSPALRALLSEESVQRDKTSRSLLRIFDNILRTQHQKDSKFRRLNISSDSFFTNIISVRGALDVLFEVGFHEDPDSNEHLIFPFGSPLEKLEWTRNKLLGSVEQNDKNSAISSTQSANQSTNQSTNQASNQPTNQSANQPTNQLTNQSIDQSANQATDEGLTSKLRSTRVDLPTKSGQACATQPLPIPRRAQNEKETAFRNMCLSYTRQVLQYENANLQAKIRSVVPFERLEKSARVLATESDDFFNENETKKNAIIKSCFLFLLLKWFKEEFFVWVNQPKCDFCHEETKVCVESPSVRPTMEEKRGGANFVELFFCPKCNVFLRFPRYNDPLKLVETRRGRCGEWANCFGAVCKTAGFLARFVSDNLDHVWTEVFSDLEGRWLHCDACETALDQPLMYEVGWGKKLAYVFAFSEEEMTDVTWRYSADHASLRLRRFQYSEKWLMNSIQKINEELQSKMSEEKRASIRKRRFKEVVEFLQPRTVKDSEKVGRSSGSLTWRLSRGEMGEEKNVKEAFLIIPTISEMTEKFLKIVYDASSDTYRRGTEVSQGFKSLIFKSENVVRKVEQDWRMAYLARQPGTTRAELTWRVQCPENVSIKEIRLRLPRSVFESGQIKVSITTDHAHVDHALSEKYEKRFGEEEDSFLVKTADVTAVLSDGKGENAWQHTQLFRESLDSPGTNGLELQIYFK